MRNLPSASSREKPSVVCVRSFVPKEKKSACSAISSARSARPRQLDHRADRVRRARPSSATTALGQLAQPRAAPRAKPTSGCMISTMRRLAGALARRACGGPHDRPHLHLVDLRDRRARAGSRGCRASGSTSCSDADPLAHRARRRLLELAAGTRAAAGRAAGSSPAAPPSPRRSPRSRPAGTAAAGRARRGAPARRRPGSSPARPGSRSSPMNMCSVRQSPMPSAPNSRAWRRRSGVSAFARTRRRRSSSAHAEDRLGSRR